MPIKPENKALYPDNWKQLSQWVRFVRAGGRCENCSAIHGQRFLFSVGQIILSAAHLDQNPQHNDKKRNLRALCQRCHLAHDRADNLAKAHLTRATKKDALRPLLKETDNEN